MAGVSIGMYDMPLKLCGRRCVFFLHSPPFAGANRGVVKGAIWVSIGMYDMPLNYVVDVRLPAS